MQQILFPLILVVSGMILGYLWQRWARKRGPRSEASIPAIRKGLQKICLLFFMPVSFVAALWMVSFEDIRVVFLPFIGAGALLLGGLFGLGVAAVLKKDQKQKGALFCCGSFTNIGAVGALVAFVFLGEAGFALVALYRMFEDVIYYTIGFPIARYYSGAKRRATFRQRIFAVSKDPFVCAAIGAFVCGLALNLSGIPRPPFFEIVNSFFIPIGTFTLLVSIGLGMRFSSVGDYLFEGVLLSAIKFIAIPLVAGTAAFAIGFADINNGLPLKVVLIASSMPVAFTALAAASIYDLDLNLANSCWLITTGALVIVLPWLAFLLTVF
ncbi:MAG: AEC family transporter, partial [Desulfobulbaceae bacterium]|nr:AEC family transporter [Desulfobulbaceae bacterium]